MSLCRQVLRCFLAVACLVLLVACSIEPSERQSSSSPERTPTVRQLLGAQAIAVPDATAAAPQVALTACQVKLVAAHRYRPPRTTDGTANLSTPMPFLIPSVIPVTAGGAARAQADLVIRSGSTPTVTCAYVLQGGATAFAFHSCSDGSRSGSAALADSFDLHLFSAAPGPAQTQLQATLILNAVDGSACSGNNPCFSAYTCQAGTCTGTPGACGTDAGSIADGQTDGASATTAFATEYCARLAACAPNLATFLYGTVDACVAQLSAAVSDPSQVTAPSCSAFLSSATCSDLVRGDNSNFPDACGPLAFGNLGDACSSDDQCLSGFCARSSADPSVGACAAPTGAPRGQSGAPCGGADDCAWGLQCVPPNTQGDASDSSSGSGTCLPLARAGEGCATNVFCDSALLLSCDGATTTCLPIPVSGPGGDCASTGALCETGSECDEVSPATFACVLSASADAGTASAADGGSDATVGAVASASAAPALALASGLGGTCSADALRACLEDAASKAATLFAACFAKAASTVRGALGLAVCLEQVTETDAALQRACYQANWCHVPTQCCSGTCVDTRTDQNNCGSCGNVCTGVCNNGACCPAGQACGAGATQTCCALGQTCCGDTCTDTNTDSNNCGACGVLCLPPQTCVNKDCQCPASAPTLCNGNCTDITSDPKNCGGCGSDCTADQPPPGDVAACFMGNCCSALAECPAGACGAWSNGCGGSLGDCGPCTLAGQTCAANGFCQFPP
ncbi:MAG TPA: hypothetical protein VE987_07275 [Polyangiaceae bacterium]|nr:hypothetical protein [Polyangiaceae bacterium]